MIYYMMCTYTVKAEEQTAAAAAAAAECTRPIIIIGMLG
jgi:hypothetical protein